MQQHASAENSDFSYPCAYQFRHRSCLLASTRLAYAEIMQLREQRWDQ
jgi:hypothetical protein